MSDLTLNYLRMSIDDSSIELSFDHNGCVRFSETNSETEITISYEEFVAVAKILSAFEPEISNV
jgi:hypothetical protein